MRCAWKELLAILPVSLRNEVDKAGQEQMQELRLRINAPPELVLADGCTWLTGRTNQDDLNFIINAASRYSPWCTTTVREGYITVPGGHRIGLCGKVVYNNKTLGALQNVDSLCIRVARSYPGIARKVEMLEGSILVIGAPGWGKTTLLRDLVQLRAKRETVCVVDERGELFPDGLPRAHRIDVLNGCPKTLGIERLIRTMGPDSIAVDEITEVQDCLALIHAAHCGVQLLATAHAGSRTEFQQRNQYQPLLSEKIFDYLVVLRKDKSYHWERMTEE